MPKRLFVRLCSFALSLLLILPAAADPAPAEPTVWLRLQGSNTIGARLAPALAQSFLERHGIAQVTIRPTAIENEFLVIGRQADASGTRDVAIAVAAHGRATGVQALATGQADIALSSRPIKAEEAQQLALRGDMRAPVAEHALALDGLAILVNPRNPVEQLGREQIARLFSGEIRNWSEVGGDDMPVTVYARDDRSGTWDTFKELVLGKQDRKSVG